jgi:hypothetical protein
MRLPIQASNPYDGTLYDAPFTMDYLLPNGTNQTFSINSPKINANSRFFAAFQGDPGAAVTIVLTSVVTGENIDPAEGSGVATVNGVANFKAYGTVSGGPVKVSILISEIPQTQEGQ